MGPFDLLNSELPKSADITRGACISDDGKYRYWLKRQWGNGPSLVFIMLNPSTADAMKDDQTIRRCMYFAKREGYSGITVLNLYAWRATNPKDLLDQMAKGVDVVGPQNLQWVRDLTKDEKKVVLAWGGIHPDKHWAAMSAVFDVLPRDMVYLCLGETETLDPRHPSRLGNNVEFEDYLPSVRVLPKDSAAYKRITGK